MIGSKIQESIFSPFCNKIRCDGSRGRAWFSELSSGSLFDISWILQAGLAETPRNREIFTIIKPKPVSREYWTWYHDNAEDGCVANASIRQ